MTQSFARPLRRTRGSVLIAPVFFIGMLAGISVPAYHDYTMRAHVTEGLNLAAGIKASVAEYYFEREKWPRDLRELAFDRAPRGQYVTFAALNHGTVVIRYSRAAGARLARGQLTLRPTVSPQGDVIWSCGYALDHGADPPSGPASPHATTLPAKFLPSSCRG
jgi:type IV pilus assembly protein PilA